MKQPKFDIKTNKNLLAFSAGIDSTALFFLLLEQNIQFDIAIVDYNLREQSKDEVVYATQLAHKYKKKCYISTFPKDSKFSEKIARDFRYHFFDKIIIDNEYDTLLTAHQLNDKLEWFLMQLTKGSGLIELLGMASKALRNNYICLKPLLSHSKQSLKNYLDTNNIKYFIDETNIDQKYKRNYFRHNFSDELIDTFEIGINNSFEYLQKDIDSMRSDISVEKIEQLHIYDLQNDMNLNIRIIDKDLKTRGIIISKSTRDEIIKTKNLVVSHKIAICISSSKIWISPYLKLSMDKKFKERCRTKKIPSIIRPYLFSINYNIDI